MVASRRHIVKPAMAFFLGIGISSLFHSLFGDRFQAPAYNLTQQNIDENIESESGQYNNEDVYSNKRPNFSLPNYFNTSHEGNQEVLEDLVFPAAILSEHERILNILNDSGQAWHEFDYVKGRLENESLTAGELSRQVFKRLSDEIYKLQTWATEPKPKPINYKERMTLYVATIICGSRRQQAGVMLKSLLVFSQDANLHLIVFSDNKTIVDVGQDLLVIKWTAQRKLGFDFSFELHMENFPSNTDTDWRSMYRPCATQRLFFPGLLTHIDSVIYLDTDVIVLSNMTQFWEHFTRHMQTGQMVAVGPNNPESLHGYYGRWLKIPFVGERGLNAAVMLMNLTRLRNFKFEQRAIATNVLFKERIVLADQDIINIVFSGFPEYVHALDCTYNLYWVHCGPPSYKCINEQGENPCFCKAALDQGIHVVHGNMGTFRSQNKDLLFLSQVFKAFSEFNLATDSALTMFDHLRARFDELAWKPCQPLNSSILYDNASRYLRNLK